MRLKTSLKRCLNMDRREFLIWMFFILGGFLSGGIMYCELVPKKTVKKDIQALSPDGNPGASNVFINCGIPLGTVCLTLDILKGCLPVLCAEKMLDAYNLRFALVMIAPVLGHALAPLNRFHGGKCIATAFGVMIALLPLTRIGLVLAGLYILFSTLIKINPNRIRSIVTFMLFCLISVTVLTYTKKYSFALGCGGISLIAVLRHTKFFSTVPENETAMRKEN